MHQENEQFSIVVLLVASRSVLQSNFLPGLALQALALLLLISYFYSPSAKDIFDEIAVLKQHYGYGFSCISTMMAGGLFPFLFVAFMRRRAELAAEKEGLPLPPRVPSLFHECIFLCLLYGEKGVEVDAFYRLQAHVFGPGNSAQELIPKVLLKVSLNSH